MRKRTNSFDVILDQFKIKTNRDVHDYDNLENNSNEIDEMMTEILQTEIAYQQKNSLKTFQVSTYKQKSKCKKIQMVMEAQGPGGYCRLT